MCDICEFKLVAWFSRPMNALKPHKILSRIVNEVSTFHDLFLNSTDELSPHSLIIYEEKTKNLKINTRSYNNLYILLNTYISMDT